MIVCLKRLLKLLTTKNKITSLKTKRALLLFLCFSFFFIPSQNIYATIQSFFTKSLVEEIDFPIPLVTFYPLNKNDIPAPLLTAESAVVVDRDSAVLVFGKNEKVQLFPASTVKVMTALVVLEYYSFDDVIVVKSPDDEGQDMELLEDEKITVKNLLYGVLVSSANDAALVLAQNYPGGAETFVKRMNEKAKELNLNDTFFANPTGLDSDKNGDLLNSYSYSTALDLARLAAVALKNENILEMVSTSYIKVTDVTGEIVHHLYNINELLEKVPGMKGLKTGWTEEAGECLIGYTEREERGIITVVLKSENRFLETKKLVDWTFENYTWEDITPSIRN